MDYAAHLKDLRESYYRSYPNQRVNVAKQRIANPEHGPNLLVTHVSAIEGLLRSLVVWGGSESERPDEDTYNKYKNWGVDSLYKEYKKQAKCGDLVSETTYQLVGYAVAYRNILAHECTYLGQDKYPQLIAACEEFFTAICSDEKIK